MPSGPQTSPASPSAAWPAAGRTTTRTAPCPSWPRRDPDPAGPSRPCHPPPGQRAHRHRPDRYAPPHPMDTSSRAGRPGDQCRPVGTGLDARGRCPGTAAASRHARPRAWPGLGRRRGALDSAVCDDVTVLADSEATAEKVLYALDGAWLGHIAAHGSFRADSPLFSSLHMYDGPLTVYDFEQLHRAPYRLVLSSCDSGVLARPEPTSCSAWSAACCRSERRESSPPSCR